MRRFPNGSVLYDDSPWFLEIVLFLFAGGLGIVGWQRLTANPPDNTAAFLLFAFAIVCVAGMLVQQRLTFYFDPSIATMHWSAKGLFGSSNGDVAFKDITVSLDTISETHGTMYRVLLTTPAGAMPLNRAYVSDRPGVERRAAEIRALLGQSSDSLENDSVRQMVQSGNNIGAIAMLRDASNMTPTDAVKKIDDRSL